MIGIVNYGLGNVQAFYNIYNRLNIETKIILNSGELSLVDRIILPGVGAFDWAMTRLNESGMRDALEDAVVEKKILVLGICVGMQIMACRSDEGVLAGFGWIDGEVKRFQRLEVERVRGEKSGEKSEGDREKMLILPHMGWNDVRPTKENGLFKELESDARFYFLHSYYFFPKKEEEVLAVTDYNGLYASAVCSGNVYGVQFHPEKSHQWGIQLLKNFADM